MKTFVISIYNESQPLKIYTPQALTPQSAIKKALEYNRGEDDVLVDFQRRFNETIPERIDDIIEEVWRILEIRISEPIAIT